MPTKKVRKRKEFVPSALGPLPVIEVEDLSIGEGEARRPIMGTYDTYLRVIEVRAGLDPKARKQTVFHEWVHAVLLDAGVRLAYDPEESVCDSIATAMVQGGAQFSGRTRKA